MYLDSLVTVDSKDLTNYLKDDGYDVEWYDVSYDTGRNAKGDMHYNPVNQKYKVILHTRPMTAEEVADFFSTIKVLKALSVTFFNPYEGAMKTISAYRGDRATTMKWNRTDKGILFESFDISLIEL